MEHSQVAVSPLTGEVDYQLVFWRAALRILLVLNLLDACFTLAWLCSGVAAEANPIMAACYAQGPAVMMISKLVLVSGGVWAIRRLHRYVMARVGLAACVLVYLAVIHVHLKFAFGMH